MANYMCVRYQINSILRLVTCTALPNFLEKFLPIKCLDITKSTEKILTHIQTHIQVMANPWAKRDAWRFEGEFSRVNRFRNAFPGFGIAVVAFSAYLAYDKFIAKKDEHHH